MSERGVPPEDLHHIIGGPESREELAMSEPEKREEEFYRVEKLWPERLYGDLNEWAAEGWRLVAMYTDDFSDPVTAVFERNNHTQEAEG